MSDTAATEPPETGSEAPTPSIVTYEISSRSIWQVIGAILLTIVALIIMDRARDLVGMLVISFFFSLALVPLVERIHARRGWKRGAAVGAIFGLAALFFIVMVVFLIPLIVEMAQSIGDNMSGWIDQANDWASDTFGVSLSSGDAAAAGEAGSNAAQATADWAKEAMGSFLGALSTGIGLIFSTMTIALFTFYLTADHQRVQGVILSTFSPKSQQKLGWTWDQAVEQTGGYFYSRIILMGINGAGFFFTMVLVGMPVLIALPLAIIAGFISEFIPAIGTYIGGAIPVVLTLAYQGLVQALIVLAYVLIYQQIENYWLSPKLSEKTMTLNGGVAFGAAIAGGAIAGPMGAFMALPIAALITSFLGHYRTTHEVVYVSQYAGTDDGDPTDTGESMAEPTADDTMS